MFVTDSPTSLTAFPPEAVNFGWFVFFFVFVHAWIHALRDKHCLYGCETKSKTRCVSFSWQINLLSTPEEILLLLATASGQEVQAWYPAPDSDDSDIWKEYAKLMSSCSPVFFQFCNFCENELNCHFFFTEYAEDFFWSEMCLWVCCMFWSMHQRTYCEHSNFHQCHENQFPKQVLQTSGRHHTCICVTDQMFVLRKQQNTVNLLENIQLFPMPNGSPPHKQFLFLETCSQDPDGLGKNCSLTFDYCGS